MLAPYRQHRRERFGGPLVDQTRFYFVANQYHNDALATVLVDR
jgi:hypothetical protein